MEEANEIKCENYEFCKETVPNGLGAKYCMDCGSWFKFGHGWDKLNIIDSTDDCIVCMNNCNRKLIFPTNCGHSFCLDCSKNILYWDETRYHLSPVPFGCPPCPNGCENPIKGKQCYCEEYDSVQNEWEKNNPVQYKKYNNDQNQSIDNSSNDVTYGKCICPLCRKKYERKFKN
jgi:hypothetical protein